jgi:hypothetical protein
MNRGRPNACNEFLPCPQRVTLHFMRRMTVIFLLWFLGCAFNVACNKSGEPAGATGTSGTGALPVGWELYHDEGHGFSVAGPGNPQTEREHDPDLNVDVSTYQFLFARNAGMGQVMVLTVGGSEPYDIEQGTDGACNGIVQNLGGTMLEYEKRTIDGKMARAFRFSAQTQGQTIKGRGLAIATGPRTIKVAMGYHLPAKAGAEELAEIFVDSFEVK